MDNTDISNEDKSKSSNDLPAQNSFMQEPKISKCENKLKCKNPGFRKNPVLESIFNQNIKKKLVGYTVRTIYSIIISIIKVNK